MIYIEAPIVIAIMALLWRIRGGWLGLPSSTLGRLLPAAWLGGCAWYLAGHDPWMLLVIPLMWAGTVFPWARWQDMGRVDDDDDLPGLSGRGLLLTWPVGAFLAVTGHGWWFMALGILMGPIYWLCWTFFAGVRVKGFGRTRFVDGATSVAELATGALLGGLLVASL